MENIFYLFSKTENKMKNYEAIYICKNNEEITCPTYKTAVYPMGTILSRVVGVLSAWAETNFSEYKMNLDFIDYSLRDFPRKESSFSNIIENDKSATLAFKNLFIEILDENYKRKIWLLENFFNYIKLCQNESYYCSTDNLNLFSYDIGYNFPKYFIKTGDETNSQNALSVDKVKKLLSTMEKNILFDPDIAPRMMKKLFDIPENQNILKSYGKLTLPVHVFQINDIVDLIAVSLKCIYEQNFVIGQCNYCENLFVTHNKKLRYCNNPIECKKSCYESKKLERQLIKEKTNKAFKKRKNIRTAMSIKLGTDNPRYIYFLETTKIKNNQMKNGKLSEDDFYNWMVEYWDDIKAKSKEARKAKQRAKKPSVK